MFFSLLCPIRRGAREARALRQATALAASATRNADPLQGILEAALTVLPSDHLVLLCTSTERNEVVIVAAAGAAQVWRRLRAPLAQGIVARAIETRQTQHFNGELRSVLVVPVIRGGQVIGVLETADERRRRFTRRHATLLEAFADQCAVAIDNARGGPSTGV